MSANVTVLSGLIEQYLRRPATFSVDGQGNVTAVFEPPLTPAEQAIFADLQIMSTFSVNLTLAEWQSIKADAAGLKAYVAVATPTLAQTAAATKAIIRVLATIVRS